MYIPKFFLEEDEQKILDFMREFNFATLVTAENDIPTATHLPFIIEKRGDKIILLAHLAKTNTHWKQFCKEILVIFQEPPRLHIAFAIRRRAERADVELCCRSRLRMRENLRRTGEPRAA